MTVRTALRRAAIGVLSQVNPGDITIRHQWCDSQVYLNSFRHKGYWLRGRSREAATMVRFATLLGPGDTVIEVGAHIGFTTQYLSHLVGECGRVVAFEPGGNNLPYLRQNARHLMNVDLVEKACGDVNETRTFFLEDLTGQNNSFLQDYDLLRQAEAKAIRAHIEPVRVEVVTIDSVVHASGLSPALLKIDVEGFEREVLSGATTTLDHYRPLIMAEITENLASIWTMLTALGYLAFDPDLRRLHSPEAIRINTFWLHEEQHAERIESLR